MIIQSFETPVVAAANCKFVVERDRKSVKLTMMVRRDETITQSVTILSVRHAMTFAEMLETKENGRIVMTDGAGSIGLHAHEDGTQFQVVEVRGKAGSLEGIVEHGPKVQKLIREIREVLTEIKTTIHYLSV